MSKSKLSPHKAEIIEKRLNGMSISELSDIYDVSYSTMRQFLYRNKVSSSDVITKEFSQDEISAIISDYINGKGYTIIAKEYGVGYKTIKTILEKNNVEIRDISHSQRIYDIDENYFDDIDTPDKAYILGILYADGNINTSSGHFTISIGLQERDVDILEKIKNKVGYSGPLLYEKKSLENSNWSNQWSLNINNKHMANALMGFGVVPNKTLVLTFPDFLTHDLIPHFLRGFWDGDGHISTKYCVACCCGNGDFIIKTKEVIEDIVGVHCCVSETLAPSGKILQLRVSGKYNTLKFLNYIYKDADLYMDRKYDTYIEYCDNSQ